MADSRSSPATPTRRRWRRLPAWLRLPLFARELIVSANDRRTYQVRIIALGIMFALYAALHHTMLGARPEVSPVSLLSTGLEMDSVLYALALVLIALASLVQCATCVSAEKEGGTLPLLLLTPLGPVRTVLQKYCSRLVDTSSLVLLVVPLLTVGYTFGGISDALLAAGSLSLAYVMLQFGAIGLFASCAARTSMGALVLAIALAAIWYSLVLGLSGSMGDGAPSFVLLDLTPLGLLRTARAGSQYVDLHANAWIALACVLPLAPTVPLIVAAARLIADWREQEAAGTAARGTQATAAMRRLPGALGVVWMAWRQSLLRRRRILVPLAGLAAFGLFGALTGALSGSVDSGEFDMLPFKIALGVVIATSCGFLASARLHQTLEPMLATPCGAEGLVHQLRAFQRRVRWALLVVLAGALLVAAVRHGGLYDTLYTSPRSAPPRWLVTAALALIALASMRNVLAMIGLFGIMVDSGTRWPWFARFALVNWALLVLVAAPCALGLPISCLPQLAGSGAWMRAHPEQFELAGWIAGACASPLALVEICLDRLGNVYAKATTYGLGRADLWFPMLLLVLPILHAVAIRALERRLLARAIARLARPVATAPLL